MKFVSEPYQGADSSALPTEELTMAEINKLGMAGQVPRLSPTWPNPRSARQNRGFVLAGILLIGSFYLSWSIAVLPIWIFLLGIHILIHNLRGQQGDDHA
jgi:hypothetical protein